MKNSLFIDALFENIFEIMGISGVEIRSPSRDREIHFARMIIAQCMRLYGFLLSDIAATLNRKSPSSIVYLIKNFHIEQTPYFKSCSKKIISLVKFDQ